MLLKCTWLLLLVLSLMAGAFASSGCPVGFKSENSRCTVDRPVHGSCPSGSTYTLSVGKCVHD
ncbi:uncharacterized protein LOC108025082 [Drosophila biarmipes]|uniref:uncharacterized protein LOC108025082 n=1 Tax=Drosophila biarmipes TaxID=125945 RepID=UPI0007E853D3|nr:uncharacterized protein LOC108025082 [Drosophila biarmipes]